MKIGSSEYTAGENKETFFFYFAFVWQKGI